jgi:hypothetical protein
MVIQAAPDHPVQLRSATVGPASSGGQLILERTDEEFLPAILAELSRPNGTADLLRTRAARTTKNGVLKLYQPVQRVFNVAVFEMVCRVPGEPRFDPARIESAGMVVRRVWRDPNDVPHFDRHEGWRQDGPTFKGWLPFDTADELDLDPDPAHRPIVRVGHPELDRRIALLRGERERLAEEFTPLFTAPPEVCSALGKTILFGVIPVASAEKSEVPEDGSYPIADVVKLLSPMLRSMTAGMTLVVPRPNAWLDPSEAVDDRLAPWLNLLRQLTYELDAFGDSPQSKALFALLEKIQIPLEHYSSAFSRPYEPSYYEVWPTRSAGTMLRQHADVLVYRKDAPDRRPGESWPGYPRVQMPPAWAPIGAALVNDIAHAAKTMLDSRVASLVQPHAARFDQRRRPAKAARPGRYDESGPMYRIRAFARVRHHEHCPTRTVWSEPSAPFAIAPWYEGIGAPPVQVALPDPHDGDFLKQLKPNVAFAVPGNLFDMLQKNSAKDLLEGKGGKGSLELDWICAFNIPILTICAFICFNIILSVLDLFLHWSAMVKVCIPVPRKS